MMTTVGYDGFEVRYASSGATITKIVDYLSDDQLQELIDVVEVIDLNIIPSDWFIVSGAPAGFPAEPWVFTFSHPTLDESYDIQFRYENSVQIDQYGIQDVTYGLYCEVYNNNLERTRFQGMMTAKVEYVIDNIMIYIKVADFDKFLLSGEFPFDVYIGAL